MNFIKFKTELQKQFNHMKNKEIFQVDVPKELLWETYLKSFPEGTNPIYKERTEYDCNCCRNFIKNIGNIVIIENGSLVSLWDVQDKLDDGFKVVTDAMSKLVKSYLINNQFLHVETVVGTDKNFQELINGKNLTWEHFHIRLPNQFVRNKKDIATELSNIKSTKEVFLRSLSEISIESIETVLELIAQNSLYRGEEHKFALTSFKKLKKDFDKLISDKDKNLFCWSNMKGIPESVTRIKNTVIGTLLTDLSEDKDLEFAVKSFESKVAPSNYKRPTALVTKSMLENAKKSLEESGLISALERRYASLSDITINNIVFADREAKKQINNNIFDELINSVPNKTKNLDKVEEVSIEQFISNILPKAESIEIMLENKHINNLVSLIAPVDLTAKNLFKWDNNFSWSYNGDFTDSIKERVKKQGGRIEGDLRCSLSWFNFDDLDLHMIEPGNYKIYYGNRGTRSPSGGTLDVDMNAGSGSTRNAVENIIYPDKKNMKEGIYKLIVNNFCKRESKDVGFEMEVEFDGITHTFNYSKAVKDKEDVVVAEIRYSKKEGFSIVSSIPSSQSVKQVWGLSTQNFHKTSVVMFSPNHWDDKTVGNKHYFFMIDGCVNEGQARGFYNEFLNEDLNKHRKALEMVGSNMKTQETNNQLSGLGFSSTQRNTLLCKVKGNFTRIVKILF